MDSGFIKKVRSETNESLQRIKLAIAIVNFEKKEITIENVIDVLKRNLNTEDILIMLLNGSD